MKRLLLKCMSNMFCGFSRYIVQHRQTGEGGVSFLSLNETRKIKLMIQSD